MKTALRKGAIPVGDPQESYDPPTSCEPSQPRVATRKVASRKSVSVTSSASQREVSNLETYALVEAMKAKDQGQSSKQPQVAEDEKEGESRDNDEENVTPQKYSKGLSRES